MKLGIKKRHSFCRILTILLCLAVLICFILKLIKRMDSVFIAQCSNYSNTAFTELVNKTILDDSDDFENLSVPSYNNKGKLSIIEADTKKINIIKAKLSRNIQDVLNQNYPAYVNVTLGSLSSIYSFNSYGPSLKIKVIPISIVECNYLENFESTGINQVRHSIYLEITVTMRYVGYTLNETEDIKTEIPICDTIISGDIPNYYGGDAIATPSVQENEVK